MNRLPKAVFLDLDDTILDDSMTIDDCWQIACRAGQPEMHGLPHETLLKAIEMKRDWFWSDRERHRVGRLDLTTARREIVRLALADLGIDNLHLANTIGDAYCVERERRMEPLPGAIDTVLWLRDAGCRLALLTNGGSAGQRAKLARFDLARLFDHVLIEGELGFGKPDPRVFERALDALQVKTSEAWMIGDNLEWDVAQPQRMGMFAVWIDFRRRGLPPASTVRPDMTVQSLAELRARIDTWR